MIWSERGNLTVGIHGAAEWMICHRIPDPTERFPTLVKAIDYAR
jgi:hypothetical protein